MIAPPAVGALWGERFDVLEAKSGGPARMTYLARDRAFGIDVELWWVVPGVHGADAMAAMANAGAALRSLQHPSVREVVDCGTNKGAAWAAYTLASPGVKPREQSPLPLPAVVAWAKAVADGLGAAHQLGWCHGRLVPDDVVLVDGKVRVGGIGLWMMAEPSAVAVWSSHAAYLAPELKAGWYASAAADVWGLAACVTALAAGTDKAIEQREWLAGRSPELAMAVSGALSLDPSARIGLAELVHRIDEALASAGPGAFAPMPSRAIAPPVLPKRPTTMPPPPPAAAMGPRKSAPQPAVSPHGTQPPAAPPPGARPPAKAGATVMGMQAPPQPGSGSHLVPPAGSRPGMAPPPQPGSGSHLVPAGARIPTPRPPGPPPRLPTPRPDAFSPSVVTGAVQRAQAAAPGEVLAVSLRPGGARPPTGQMAAAAAAQQQPPPPMMMGHDQPRVVMRPLSELSAVTVEPGEIGYVAPPRGLTPPRRRWVPVVGILFGAAAAATIAIVVATQTGVEDTTVAGGSADEPVATGGGSGSGTAAPGSAAGSSEPGSAGGDPGSAAPPAPRHLLSPVEPARGCTDETLAHGDICIDPYEAPGRGRVPVTGLTARAAADACAARGLRLCTPEEWRAACAGTEKALAEAGACNLGTGGMIVAGGAFEKCISAIEAHDLAGNVAEWVADGTALGASAMDGGDGHCDGPPRKVDADAVVMDVGYRCCGDR